MAQTPARDIIKTAIVDFRFYGGDLRNYANNANTLVTSGFAPTFQPAHGVMSLLGSSTPADQTWMTTAGQDAATIEALLSLDMLHLGASSVAVAENVAVIDGDWQLGFMTTPRNGQETEVSLWASFSSAGFDGSYIIKQVLSKETVLSAFKGSPIHVVLSVAYDSVAPLFSVTTCINGVTSTDTSANINFTMDDTPENTIFDSTVQAPVFLLRMWDTYQADAFVLADLYREARKVFPLSAFPAPSGDVQLYIPA